MLTCSASTNSELPATSGARKGLKTVIPRLDCGMMGTRGKGPRLWWLWLWWLWWLWLGCGCSSGCCCSCGDSEAEAVAVACGGCGWAMAVAAQLRTATAEMLISYRIGPATATIRYHAYVLSDLPQGRADLHCPPYYPSKNNKERKTDIFLRVGKWPPPFYLLFPRVCGP